MLSKFPVAPPSQVCPLRWKLMLQRYLASRQRFRAPVVVPQDVELLVQLRQSKGFLSIFLFPRKDSCTAYRNPRFGNTIGTALQWMFYGTGNCTFVLLSGCFLIFVVSCMLLLSLQIKHSIHGEDEKCNFVALEDLKHLKILKAFEGTLKLCIVYYLEV
nr:hypothetical protein Iba_chr13fCG6470 [Ipomoea batatas]